MSREMLKPRTILAIGFALFLVYAFPGYMSNDSVVQLIEGRNGMRTNGHPPIMAFEWGLLDAIVSGPILMLLVQASLFLGGLYGLLRRVMSPVAAAICADAILLFPPVLTTMAVIWKDSQMAGYILAGTALLLCEQRRWRLVGWGLVTLGCAFRHNAFGATVPILTLLFVWRPGLARWRRYAIALGAAVLSTVTAFGITRVLTVKHQYLMPAYVDIVGVLAYTHDRTDEDLEHVLRGTPLQIHKFIQTYARVIYTPRNPIGIDHGSGKMFDTPKTEEQRAALTRAWAEIVPSDLGAYVQMRLAGFEELLGWTDNPPFAPVWADFLGDASQMTWIDHLATRTDAQARMMRWFSELSDTWLFRPYIYAIVALLLLALCRDRVSLALIGSGIGYELTFFFAAGTPDFRYSHWMITAVVLAAILIAAQRARRAS